MLVATGGDVLACFSGYPPSVSEHRLGPREASLIRFIGEIETQTLRQLPDYRDLYAACTELPALGGICPCPLGLLKPPGTREPTQCGVYNVSRYLQGLCREGTSLGPPPALLGPFRHIRVPSLSISDPWPTIDGARSRLRLDTIAPYDTTQRSQGR